MAINQDKLHEFLGKAIVDVGATFNAALIRIGDKLGLYKALASGGPQTPAELAKRTGTAERYVREWLSAQAAGGYVTYDSSNGRFHLSEEQAFAMADESRHWLARTPSGALRLHGKVFSSRLCRKSHQHVDSSADRC